MKKILTLLVFLALLLPVCASAQDAPIPALTPADMMPVEGFEPAALYCGPTQGFYRYDDQTLDLAQPFVCFGQYDCWSMVAQGTAESFGPVGFIEGGLFDAQDVPELSFEDSFAAMVEEDAVVTNDPQNPDGLWEVTLPRGTGIIVLAGYGDWLYVQTEIEGTPARVFIPSACVM